MSRRQKDPLRRLTKEERCSLDRLSRSQSQPAARVARAKALLMVADNRSYTAAARAAGYRVGDTVAHLVNRFNREGLNALEPRHGGGMPASYGAAETERILAEVRRMSQHQGDGTASWSISQLKQALRQAPDGLPHVSTYTIQRVLHEAGYHWEKNRGWCETRQARKAGTLTAIDPAVAAKNLIEGQLPTNPVKLSNSSKRLLLDGTASQRLLNGRRVRGATEASVRATTGTRRQ